MISPRNIVAAQVTLDHLETCIDDILRREWCFGIRVCIRFPFLIAETLSHNISQRYSDDWIVIIKHEEKSTTFNFEAFPNFEFKLDPIVSTSPSGNKPLI